MQRSPSRFKVEALAVLLVVSAGVNMVQAYRLSLAGDCRPLASRIARSAPAAVAGVSLDGNPVYRAVAGSVPTVVYYFRSTCTWCQRNWANIEALHRAADGRYRVLALSAETGLQAYAKARGLSLELLEGVNPETLGVFGFSVTPDMVVVSPEGQITHEWRGAFTPRMARQVEDLFGLQLPGLSDAAPTPRSPASW